MTGEHLKTPFSYQPPNDRIVAVVTMRTEESWVLIGEHFVYEARVAYDGMIEVQMAAPLRWAYR